MDSVNAIGIYGNGRYESYLGNNTMKAVDNTASFDAMFQSAVDMINETNGLTNKAEEEEIKYALGQSESTHDLMLAQQKANISLQYTVAVRNSVLDAYKEIMNLQF